ncbi:hypothetical protein [Olsenella porci]|uniref:Uncharacterized protein n=1 Tax=Olsenella porci TaxID=2652279 RepID=A0A6N7XDJ0_9ACTN|nr:hypothetical protein [Olsenella porci]MST73367.1 hypothetical protein [Olsenella porci]
MIALAGRDVRFLNRQMRYLMPAGFALALISLAVDRARWSPAAMLRHVISLPALPLLIAGRLQACS